MSDPRTDQWQADALHTGDDDLLDHISAAMAGLEATADEADVEELREAIAGALEDLAQADKLRVAELRAAEQQGAATRAALAQIVQYAEHKNGCRLVDPYGRGQCSCGLAELRDRIAALGGQP